MIVQRLQVLIISELISYSMIVRIGEMEWKKKSAYSAPNICFRHFQSIFVWWKSNVTIQHTVDRLGVNEHTRQKNRFQKNSFDTNKHENREKNWKKITKL